MITSQDQAPRIAVLWSRLPGYAYACVSALAARIGNDRVWCGSLGDPPSYFAETIASGQLPVSVFSRQDNYRQVAEDILARLLPFRPDVVVGSGWALKAWLLVAKQLRQQGVATVAMADTPWLGTFRQAARCVLGRQLLRRSFDALWIPGARGYPVARLAGYADDRLWQNMLACDAETYSAATPERLQAAQLHRRWPRRFLFVGRLVEVKNIVRLMEAYEQYAASTPHPWSLAIAGGGACAAQVRDLPGVERLGPLPPSEVLRVMAESGCLVLPSTYDAWGVVVHEACCAGLPLVLSWAVGAGAELLRDGYNGRGADPRRPESLAAAMRWVSTHPEPWVLGRRSFGLSHQFSPQLWADGLVMKSTELLAGRPEARGHA